jgi:SAM-dependent methyltransferase
VIRPIAPNGLHEFVGESIQPNAGAKALDLGTGRGAMAERLQIKGFQILAVDISASWFEANTPHVTLDLNQPDFSSKLGIGSFDLITAIEVIEHLESPINFLRNVSRLLAPSGIAILTTPNVDSLPARLKHLISGKIRMMDEQGEPGHISPIFFDIFRRKFLPICGLRIRVHLLFPPNGFHASRRSIAWVMRQMCRFLPAPALGDHHVFVLEKDPLAVQQK